jgi:hypothetical protein
MKDLAAEIGTAGGYFFPVGASFERIYLLSISRQTGKLKFLTIKVRRLAK